MDCVELFHPILDSAAMADLLLQHQLEDLDRFLSLEEEEDGDKPQVSASTVSNASVSSSSRITGSPQVQPLGPPAEDDKPVKRRKTTSSSNDSKRSSGKKPKLEDPASASASAPAGFIHVRARRGEATDSHSLAERARRGKISERMRVLQSLVPGCDKIKGKQLILDEIINYVQSLQNQIEFLSTKIASLSGVLHTFGIDSGDCMNQLTPEETTMRMNMPQLMPSSVGEINPCFLPRSEINDYQMMGR